MPSIRSMTTKELSQSLSATDFDLMDFVPSNLSAEDNQKAIEKMTEYGELYMESIETFLDLYDEKRKLNEQIAITEKKVTPGCLMNLLVLFGSYLLGTFSAAMIVMIPLVALALISPSFMDNDKNIPFVMIPIIVLNIACWIFFAIKLRKWLKNKQELAKLDSLKQNLASIQLQMDETKRNLDYPAEANEEQVSDEICQIVDNFCKTWDLLKKREVIHNDTTLSSSACLLAIEKLYDVLRQEKHNKAMEQATYAAADRLAEEVARQEETNRMVNAFLAGLSNSRNR